MNWLFARLYFYPSLYWNRALCHWLKKRNWWDWVDDHLLLGALPVASDVPALHALGVRGVINTCEEYSGPAGAYARYGIEQLHLPTIDFTPPTLEACRAGVAFLEKHIQAGNKVYVHCKAGRGRSATIALCYLIARGATPEDGQALLLQKRPQVNRRLKERPVVLSFARELSVPAK